MCEVCHQTPCRAGCPNASEPKMVMRCSKCMMPFQPGDRHFQGLCEECLDDMRTPDWLKLFGEKFETVKEDYGWT